MTMCWMIWGVQQGQRVLDQHPLLCGEQQGQRALDEHALFLVLFC